MGCAVGVGCCFGTPLGGTVPPARRAIIVTFLTDYLGKKIEVERIFFNAKNVTFDTPTVSWDVLDKNNTKCHLIIQLTRFIFSVN